MIRHVSLAAATRTRRDDGIVEENEVERSFFTRRGARRWLRKQERRGVWIVHYAIVSEQFFAS